MALRLHLGLPRLKGRLPDYAKSFDSVEVPCEPAPPTAKFAAKLRREAPDGFNFTLVANRALGELATSTLDSGLVEATRRTAETLGARWLLVRTPASAAPSTRTRSRLSHLFESLAGAAQGLAWEPRGMWSDEELAAIAEELGITVVRDLAEQDAPPGPIVYTRLLALGRNSRLGSGAIERVTDRLMDVEEAFVIVEGERAIGVAKRLRQSLGEAQADGAMLGADELAELTDGDESDDEDAEFDEEDDEALDDEQDEA
jgi:uncharacterized protein YecE (DUF72 family)